MDTDTARVVDELWDGSDRWRLPSDNSGLDGIGQEHTDAGKASLYRTTSSITSAVSVVGMVLVSLYHVSNVNKRLGVAIKAFVVSFPVRQLIS